MKCVNLGKQSTMLVGCWRSPIQGTDLSVGAELSIHMVTVIWTTTSERLDQSKAILQDEQPMDVSKRLI